MSTLADKYRVVNSVSQLKLYRRANLIRLLEAFPSKINFAERCGLNPSHVSQLYSGISKMGDTIARTIEKKLDLSDGSMDLPPVDMPDDVEVSDDMEIDPIDMIKDVIQATPTQINKIARILGYRKNRKILDQFRHPSGIAHDVVTAWIDKSRRKEEAL